MKAMRHDQAVRTTYIHIYTPFLLFTNSSSFSTLISDSTVRSQRYLALFYQVTFLCFLFDLFRCKNILKWIVSLTKEIENFI